MAVQAQYPSNVLLYNRSEQQERKEMDYTHQANLPPGFLDQTPPFFLPNGGVNGNQRKRGRESSSSAAAAAAAVGFQMVPTPQMNLFSPSIQSPALINLAQLQAQTNHHPSLVSTGLRLSFEDNDIINNNNNNSTSSNQTQAQSQMLQHDLASLINAHKEEIDQYLVAQGEQLRRTLAGRRQKHYRALLSVAEESAARRLREKDIELDRAARKAAELEDRVARLRTESLTWQAKAMADQATAASLHAQIQQAQMATAAAAARKPDECGESSGAEDAESAHVDPDRVQGSMRACRVCRSSAVSVVLLPCRHLCMCSACDAAVGDSDATRCPVCHAVRTGSVQVFLS